MAWPDYDGETMFHSIDEAIEYETDNAFPCRDEFEMKLSLAKSIPSATVRVFNVSAAGVLSDERINELALPNLRYHRLCRLLISRRPLSVKFSPLPALRGDMA